MDVELYNHSTYVSGSWRKPREINFSIRQLMYCVLLRNQCGACVTGGENYDANSATLNRSIRSQIQHSPRTNASNSTTSRYTGQLLRAYYGGVTKMSAMGRSFIL